MQKKIKNSISNENKKIISKIINGFNFREMSAFIGAGFSKNANTAFPSWFEFLHDMVEEMYSDELLLIDAENEYDKKDKLIRKKGFLNIPEEYKTFKSDEALDLYVENIFLPLEESIKPNNLNTHISLLELPWMDVFTTNYDSLLEKSSAIANLQWETITSSDQISAFQPRKRILKIHGSIEPIDKYEFDGRKEHKYILTKNDYDTYNKLHPGFSRFMSTKILENSVCLIGFSGNDPNFKNWINWIETVIKQNDSKLYSKPIYLIDVSEDVPSELERLYKKYNIIRLSLPEIYHWLVENVSLPIENGDSKLTPSNMLHTFFTYLKENIIWENSSIESVSKYLTDKHPPIDYSGFNVFWDNIIMLKGKEIDKYLKLNINILKKLRLSTPRAISSSYKLISEIQISNPNNDLWDYLLKCCLISKYHYILPHYIISAKWNSPGSIDTLTHF